MIIAFLLFLSTIISFVIPLSPDITIGVLKVELIIYIVMILADIYITRRLTLFSTWLVAYIFIIWSDMVLCAYTYPSGEFSIPILFYLLGNNCLLLGYCITKPKNNGHIKLGYNIKHQNYMAIFILFLIAIYIVLQVENVMMTLAYGRVLGNVKGSGSIINLLVGGIGLIVPSIIAYYVKYHKKWPTLYSVILALPIFVIEFILGTRFRILFQVLPFLMVSGIVKFNNLKFRNLLVLFICAIILSLGSNFIKENRLSGYNNYSTTSNIYSDDKHDDKYINLASNMSPEGIIYMAHLANRYFENNSLTYGKEISFLLYFWVPRSIWKDKPTPIDHWLIRKYENVPDEHSTASGFLGELRADFGWFALLFAILIGIIIRHCDHYINKLLTHKNRPYQIILAATLYPYFFFFVRSPITSTISMSFALIIYYIIRKCFCTQTKYKYESPSNKFNS